VRIAAIMPCRGRAEQTITNVRRLLATAGHDNWQLICMIDDDPAVDRAVADADLPIWRATNPGRSGYWRNLQAATDHWPEFPYLVNLANDLLPGQHWLKRAVEAYRQQFGENAGLLGFNGDSHEVGHSCHFLISRALLSRYGGWPVWYDHNYGDTELCARAIQDRCYAKAPWAILFHDHPYFGGQDDPVYAEGRAMQGRDATIYERRKRSGWTYDLDAG
jgi:hypothetical protein